MYTPTKVIRHSMCRGISKTTVLNRTAGLRSNTGIFSQVRWTGRLGGGVMGGEEGEEEETPKQTFFLERQDIFLQNKFSISLTFAPSVSTSPFNLEDPERNQKQELRAFWTNEATKSNPLKHFEEKENDTGQLWVWNLYFYSVKFNNWRFSQLFLIHFT